MHYSEDDLILHYYGEGRRRPDVEKHLDMCATCATVYRDIARTLTLVAAPGHDDVPERGEQYGLEVWQRIRHQLPEPYSPWWMLWTQSNRLALVAAAALLVLAAFTSGRLWPRPAAPITPAPTQASDVTDDASERVRLVAIGDHLERSERVLLDLMNADGAAVDVSHEQAWAADLIDSNRLYRQSAARAGETMVAGVLEELERSLLEIVHGPSKLTPAELEAIRLRLDAAALLFKVRVLHDELRERETPTTTPRKTT